MITQRSQDVSSCGHYTNDRQEPHCSQCASRLWLRESHDPSQVLCETVGNRHNDVHTVSRCLATLQWSRMFQSLMKHDGWRTVEQMWIVLFRFVDTVILCHDFSVFGYTSASLRCRAFSTIVVWRSWFSRSCCVVPFRHGPWEFDAMLASSLCLWQRNRIVFG